MTTRLIWLVHPQIRVVLESRCPDRCVRYYGTACSCRSAAHKTALQERRDDCDA
jgi:hypothetical protein